MHNIAVTVIIIAEGERAVRKEASRSKLESFFFLLLLLLIFIIFVVFIVVIPFGEPHRLPRLSFESLFRSGASTIFPFLVLGSDGRALSKKQRASFFIRQSCTRVAAQLPFLEVLAGNKRYEEKKKLSSAFYFTRKRRGS